MTFLEVANRHAPLKTRKVKSEYNPSRLSVIIDTT